MLFVIQLIFSRLFHFKKIYNVTLTLLGVISIIVLWHFTRVFFSRLYLVCWMDGRAFEHDLIDCLNCTVGKIRVKRFYIFVIFFSFQHWALSSKQWISGDIKLMTKSNVICSLLLLFLRKLTLVTEGSLPSRTTALITDTVYCVAAHTVKSTLLDATLAEWSIYTP